MLALVSLLGCTFFPDAVDSPGDTSKGNLPLVGDCDPNILVPAGLLPPDDAVHADGHAESYGNLPLPRHVHLGIPSRDLSRSVAMLWQTDADTMASMVRIGPTATWPDGAVDVYGASYLYGGVELGTGEVRQHEAHICGELEPSTAYTYQVGGGLAWSEPVSFSTPGEPGSFDTFRVAISGDSRGNYETWQAIVEAADSYEPDLYIFTGDMVNFGTIQSEWDDWFNASEAVFARKHLIATHGNHEFLAQHYFAQFAFPGNEEWYAIDYGDMLLVNLNDTVRDQEQITSIQAAFADEEFANTSARWKVAMHHQPEYSATRGHGSNADLQAAWAPIWDARDVDLLLTGHNHAYERSVPLRGGVEDPTGTTYIVSGGSGAPIYVNHDETTFSAVITPIEHFVIADFSPTGIDIVARDLSGNVIDELSLPR